jgi:hypothetical protein
MRETREPLFTRNETMRVGVIIIDITSTHSIEVAKGMNEEVCDPIHIVNFFDKFNETTNPG